MQGSNGLSGAHPHRERVDPRQELLSLRLEAVRRRRSAEAIIRPQARAGSPIPLSFAQERLWFLDQLGLVGSAYNTAFGLRLKGELNVLALEVSLVELARRHEILRTRVGTEQGVPHQLIDSIASLTLRRVDLSTCLSSDAREQQLHALMRAEQLHRFDLSRGPLFRLSLLALTAREHVLLVTMHHIAFDGWSLGVFLRELNALYTAFARGEKSPLPDLRVQYADYAIWQRESMRPGVIEERLRYWRKQLEDVPDQLRLPTDRPRPAVESFKGATLKFEIPDDLYRALKELGSEEGATLFMVSLAAYQVLLAAWSGQNDIVVGSPIAGRQRPEVEPLIGFFVNTLALRTRISTVMSFRELLREVKGTTLGAYANQDLPFEAIVKDLRSDRSLARQQLFQVTLALQNFPEEQLALPGLTCTRIAADWVHTHFDLTLYLFERGGHLSGMLEYATDLFEAGTIERMAAHLRTLLDSVVTEPDRPVGKLRLLSEAEQRAINERSTTSAPLPEERLIHRLFENQVACTPEARAVVYERQSLSYSELNREAERVARYLRFRGVGPDQVVGVCTRRSVHTFVAILGILKAGGAYLPLDPDYPSRRLEYMIRDSRPGFVLTDRQAMTSLPETDAEYIEIDNGVPEVAEVIAPAAQRASPNQLAYVIYTSGSTGDPKGVMIEHGSVINLWQGLEPVYAKAGSHSALNASLSFDASVQQIVQLLSGRTVFLIPQEVRADAALLIEYLVENRIHTIDCTPSQLHAWISAGLLTEANCELRAVLVGGEAVDQELWSTMARAQGIEFYNVYGPTECTVDATIARVSGDTTPPHIGRPMPNRRVYILDDHRQMVPIGVVGEIYLGGEGVGRGYLNRADLTTARFLPDPFNGGDGKMYRTGDLGRWRANGAIEYVGRNDGQVKIRGFRIELGEIEARIAQHPAVRRALVLAKGDGSSERRLVAYVVGDRRAQIQAPSVESSQELRALMVDDWEKLHEETYGSQKAFDGPNFVGWTSSYTDHPIALAEMEEWLGNTIARIRSCSPRRILEIGCGVGLLLQHLAPDSEAYVGADFSPSAVKQLRQWVEGQAAFSRVQLLQRSATQLGDLPTGSFDTIVLNSVVQYFPDIAYLLAVLHEGIRLVRPGGRIFLGDIRHLGCLRIFHSAVQLGKASATLNIGQLRSRIARAASHDKELLIDPQFFRELPGCIPGIRAALVQLKRGRAENELTRYRYDVVLHVGETIDAEILGESVEWARLNGGVAQLDAWLEQRRCESLCVRGIPNRRLARDEAADRLIHSSEERRDVSSLRSELIESQVEGVDPERLWQLAQSHDYEAIIEPESGPCFRVRFIDRRHRERLLLRYREKGTQAKDWAAYASDPLESGFRQKLVPQLREYLKECLPDYMVPTAWVVLKELPLTPSGKVDRRALPAPDVGASLSGHYDPPEGAVEERLAEIWQSLLQVDQVGRDDDFFELGGHSLLAIRVLSRVHQVFGSDLKVLDLYGNPTIRQLAVRLSGPGAFQDTYVDLAEEAVLPPDIVGRREARRTPPKTVLLTGATGFVGRFLLTQLLRGSNAVVACLVRAPAQGDAIRRIRRNLESWGLWQEEFGHRIVAIPGDLKLPRLGLDATSHEWLCQRTDSIYHCATSMNHLETYASARAANVEGMKDLLKIATLERSKQVNYISTIGIFSSAGGPAGRVVDESTPIDHERHSCASGYAASKWVAEKILMIAGERGVPCNIFRLGLVWADSERGRYDEMQREYRILRSCLLSGFGIADYTYPLAPLPVDHVARAIVALAGQDKADPGVFHIVGSKPFERVFERCNSLAGTSLELLPFHEWISQLKRLHQQGKTLPAVPLVEYAFNLSSEAFAARQSAIRSAGLTRIGSAQSYAELEKREIALPALDDALLVHCVQELLSGDAELRRHA